MVVYNWFKADINQCGIRYVFTQNDMPAELAISFVNVRASKAKRSPI